jgi:hypothetical protein
MTEPAGVEPVRQLVMYVSEPDGRIERLLVDPAGKIARLTQLLAAAQLDRDQAQADARAALARAEQLAGVLAEVLKRMWNECNDAGFVSFRTEWVPAATVAEWRWILAGPAEEPNDG